MSITFYKFHGAGNDFILADNRQGAFSLSGMQHQEGIAALCNRHLGIGADGLMLLEQAPALDFKMIYYNSNGLAGTMCGNGGRCMVAFARHLGIIKEQARFMASDGIHQAKILDAKSAEWIVALKMLDAVQPVLSVTGYEINTGSPHLVIFHPDIASLDVPTAGRNIRYSEEFYPNGINVNFVQVIDQQTLRIRTYERGVENETLACGTGSVAAAIAARTHGIVNPANQYTLKTQGGNLQVSFSVSQGTDELVKDIVLTGPAQLVFTGEFNL